MESNEFNNDQDLEDSEEDKSIETTIENFQRFNWRNNGMELDGSIMIK